VIVEARPGHRQRSPYRRYRHHPEIGSWTVLVTSKTLLKSCLSPGVAADQLARFDGFR